MNFTDIFIRRPVLATVLSLIILLVGVVSYHNLTVRQFPEIETSTITINTTYPGASAKLMESFVASPIENAIAGIEGIDYVTSRNSQNRSSISIRLKEGYDINQVINDVSDKVASVRGKLPQEVDDPIIAKDDPNSDPTVYISFSSKEMSPQEITDYLIRIVKPEIETVDGVGSTVIFGEKRYAMRIWLNPILMAAQNITASDVEAVLRANNIQSTAGEIRSNYQLFNVVAKTDLNTAEQFNRLVIKENNGNLIRLADIGYAELGAENDRSSTFMRGERSLVLGVITKSTANPLDVAKGTRAILPKLQSQFPRDLEARIEWDSSKFIAESIHEVYKTILEACVFVIVVIFLFLGSARAVLIPAVTIPLSLLGVAAGMHAMHFSLNTLTLLAWVLAIGMVVDDAIVVLENIHRHIEAGLKPLPAALKGAHEIRFAIISMTMTLAAVYAPIGLADGFTGTLFREFAFSLAGAVIVSGFIALTLSPMMCSKILSGRKEESRFERYIENTSERVRHHYKTYLTRVFKKRYWVIGTAALVYVLCAWLWTTMPNELAPAEDQGALIGMAFGPTGSTLQYTEKYTQEIEKIYQSVPEMESYGIINGFPEGERSSLSFLILRPWSKRSRSASEIRDSLFPQMFSIPGMLAFPILLPSLPDNGGGRTPVEFILKSTADYRDINQAVEQITQAAMQNPGLQNVDVDTRLNKPELYLSIDRNKAADLGVSMREIATTFAMGLAEPEVTQFVVQGRSYSVIPQLMRSFRQNPEQLNSLYVRTRTQDLVPLSNLVTMHTRLAPESLQHFQQLRAIKLTANLAPGYTLGAALEFLKQTADSLLPKNIRYDYGGESRQFIQASGTLIQIFFFAIVFIYLVLSAQFESFRDPIIVMASVPLSLTGALLAMRLTGSTMNIYTQIGLVTLVGLITKHGILMVEFANQLRAEGRQIKEAILEAATTRLRPILMTTAAMILGAVPLALASGAGAASRSQMGWVIVGGMAFGTMLTLFVVPVVYLFLASKRAAATEELDKNALENTNANGVAFAGANELTGNIAPDTP